MKNNDNALTIEFIKETVRELIYKEAIKENVIVKVYNICYRKDIEPKKYVLNKDKYKNIIINNFGNDVGVYINISKEIFLFFNGYKTRIKHENLGKENYFAECIHTAYHEFRHAMKFQKIQKLHGTREGFIYDMEDVIRYNMPYNYRIMHDAYFSEIDANLYAIEKTVDYFEKNIAMFRTNSDYLWKKLKRYNYEYTNYDFEYFFSLFCSIIKKEPVLINRCGNYIKSIFDNTGNIRSINELIKNETMESLDRDLLYRILASDEILNELEFPVKEEHKYILEQALKYRITITDFKYISNKEFPKSEKRYREEKEKLNGILKKIKDGPLITSDEIIELIYHR